MISRNLSARVCPDSATHRQPLSIQGEIMKRYLPGICLAWIFRSWLGSRGQDRRGAGFSRCHRDCIADFPIGRVSKFRGVRGLGNPRYGRLGSLRYRIAYEISGLERIKKNCTRAAGTEDGGGSGLFGLGLRFASVTAPWAGMLLRQRPMIGTTRPRPKIRAPRWLQFFFIRSKRRREEQNETNRSAIP